MRRTFKGEASLFLILWVLFLSLSSYGETSHQNHLPPDRLNLLIIDIVSRYPPYADFCRRYAGECDLRGADTIKLNADIRKNVRRINAAVNKEIKFVLDIEQYGREEFWNYPFSGQGDCEDKALQKRKNLFQSGLPRGAMRLALVFHKKHTSSHCVLTLETTEGTYVLDSFTDDVRLWHQTPYNFEIRERQDKAWERFNQGVWSYEP